MQTNKERFPALVAAFRLAVYDKLKEACTDGKYQPSIDLLRPAAFAALKEVVDGEADAVSPMLAVAVWQAVMLMNDSAFNKLMQRDIERGSLTGIQMVKGARGVASTYMGD